MLKRTHNCGDLRSSEIDKKVILNGWVNKVRLHGQVVFIDLRDRYGKTQIVFDAVDYDGEFEDVKKISMEDVLAVKGLVRPRIESAINPSLPSGKIEVIVSEFILLSESAPLPFMLDNRDNAEENLRLKYRYLELRMEELQKNILI